MDKAIANVIRGDEAPDNVQLFIQFLRLPPRLQELLSSAKAANRPATLGPSNAHRMAAHYLAAMVGRVIWAIVVTDTILFMTFADLPGTLGRTRSRRPRLEGRDPREWRQAALVTEKGWRITSRPPHPALWRLPRDPRLKARPAPPSLLRIRTTSPQAGPNALGGDLHRHTADLAGADKTPRSPN